MGPAFAVRELQTHLESGAGIQLSDDIEHCPTLFEVDLRFQIGEKQWNTSTVAEPRDTAQRGEADIRRGISQADSKQGGIRPPTEPRQQVGGGVPPGHFVALQKVTNAAAQVLPVTLAQVERVLSYLRIVGEHALENEVDGPRVQPFGALGGRPPILPAP